MGDVGSGVRHLDGDHDRHLDHGPTRRRAHLTARRTVVTRSRTELRRAQAARSPQRRVRAPTRVSLVSRRPGSSDPVPLQHAQVLLARDHPPTTTAAMLGSGSWVRLRRGAYLPAPPGDDRWDARRSTALARIAAVGHQLRLEHVVSHQSAALLWGLPMVDRGELVHLVQRTRPNTRGADDVVRHIHRLDAGDVVVRSGRAVTSLERTLVDCATSLRPSDALVIADAGLRRGADLERCLELLDRQVGRPGTRRARAVLEAADDGAESPGESRTRHLVLREGLPVPQTQLAISTDDGVVWADLGWREWRVVAEYDGAAKYTASGPAADAVLRERRREVVIERAGWRVVRIAAADLRQPARVVAALLRLAPPGSAALRPRRWLADPPPPRSA